MNKDSRILIVLPSDALGGAEQFLKLIAKQSLKYSAEVYVLFLKEKKFNGWVDLSNFLKINLIYGKSDSEAKGLPSFIWNIRKLSKTAPLDYIFSSHVHLTGAVGILIRTKVIRTKYFVGRESTSIFKRFSGVKLYFFKFLYRTGYPALDLLICQTNFMKLQLVQGVPQLIKTINVEVIPNPIDLDSIAVSTSESGIDDYGKFIIAAGRLIKLKGFDLLISAFAKIKDKSLNLVILGEGPERNNLTDLTIKLGVADRVFLPGWIANVYPYFKNAEVCVVSSIIEGFPNVLLQMMSQNTSVVSTKCAGDIENIKGVMVCETESSSALKKVIEKALHKSTTGTRNSFDDFLHQRSIVQFINKVNHHLTA